MRWRIGDVTVTKIVELEVTGGSRFILPQATREAIQPIAWLRPHFADEDGRLRMSIHSLVAGASPWVSRSAMTHAAESTSPEGKCFGWILIGTPRKSRQRRSSISR